MRMKKLCSAGLALLLAAALALPASAAEDFPVSPADSLMDSQLGPGLPSEEKNDPVSEGTLEPEGGQPPAGEVQPGEEQPPAGEVQPEEEQPPTGEVQPEEEQPPAGEVQPEEERPPAGEVQPEEQQPPAGEVQPGEELPPAEAPGQETGLTPGEVPEPQGGVESPQSRDVIDVLVPGSGEIIINPYHLERALDSGTTTEQIIHQPQSLLNLSSIPVRVDVSVVGTVPEESAAAFVLEPPPADTEEKDIFLYVEFQNSAGQWLDGYAGAPNQVLISQNASESQSVLALDPRGEGFFRVSGCMSSAAAWTTDDTFGAILVFSFTALSAGEAEPGTIPPEGESTFAKGIPPILSGDSVPPEIVDDSIPPVETDSEEPQVPEDGETDTDSGELRLPDSVFRSYYHRGYIAS